MKDSLRPMDHGELRKFGMLMAAALALLGTIVSLRGCTIWPFILPFSLSFLLLGLFKPSLLSGIYKGWMKFAEMLGRISTTVILILFFFLAVAPVGIMAKIFGKEFLSIKPEQSVKSYWKRREYGEEDAEGLERQF